MRRLSVAVSALALFGASLTGCGGGDDNASDTSSAASLSGKTIEVAAVWSGTEQSRFQKVLDGFQAKTGATVKFTSTGDEIASVLQPRMAAGSAPDVAILPQPGLLNDFAKQNRLVDVSSAVDGVVSDNYSADWKKLGQVDGKTYGVWYKAANKSTVWYNVKVLKDAGVSTPATWDDFIKAAGTIADSGVAPISVGGGDGWTLTDWFENVYLRSAGADKYDQLSNHQIPWTDPSVKGTLTKLGDLWNQQRLLTGGTSGATLTDFPGSVSKVFSTPPQGAIVYEGDFVGGVITGTLNKKLETDADFFDFPSVGGSKPAVVGGGDVAVVLKDSASAKGGDTAAAQEFVKYLASPEAAELWAKQGGFLSPNKKVNTSVYPDAITKRLAESLVKAETFRFDMSDLQPAAFGGTKGAGEWKILQDFLAKPTTVDATAAALEASRKAAG